MWGGGKVRAKDDVGWIEGRWVDFYGGEEVKSEEGMPI